MSDVCLVAGSLQIDVILESPRSRNGIN